MKKMNLNGFAVGLLIFACCLMIPEVRAADALKIAVVDMQKVFSNYKRTELVDKKLQEQMDVFRQYSLKLTGELKKLKQDFEDARNASQDNLALTEAERTNKSMLAKSLYEQMLVKEAELKNYNQNRQQQMRETYEKMRNDILNEIRKTVQNIATLRGYQLVLDKSGATMNDISAVVFYLPKMEITDDVLESLNRSWKPPEPSKAIAPASDNKTTKK